MERSCRRRCRRADNYDSGGRTLVVIVGSCLGFGIDSRFQHFFLFELGGTGVY